MSLTLGTAPFGRQPAGVFNFKMQGPAHVLYFEDSPRRIRAIFRGETIVDTRRGKLLHETGLPPVLYFPRDDVRLDLLEATDHATHCPFKGDASYWSVRVGDEVAENTVWSYPDTIEGAPPLAGYLAFFFKAMDHWLEEDEEMLGHPRDPYHRVDVRQSSRPVRVRVNGEVVASSTRPRILFETSLPPRYYLPPEDVRTSLLEPSDTVTQCAYKGLASYHSARVNGEVVADVAWSYLEPLTEATPVAGYLCFSDEHADIELDRED